MQLYSIIVWALLIDIPVLKRCEYQLRWVVKSDVIYVFTLSDTDPTVQDDEVELLLHALRNESCFHCPIKQKMAHKLNETNMPKLLKKHDTFAVLFKYIQ